MRTEKPGNATTGLLPSAMPAEEVEPPAQRRKLFRISVQPGGDMRAAQGDFSENDKVQIVHLRNGSFDTAGDTYGHLVSFSVNTGSWMVRLEDGNLTHRVAAELQNRSGPALAAKVAEATEATRTAAEAEVVGAGVEYANNGLRWQTPTDTQLDATAKSTKSDGPGRRLGLKQRGPKTAQSTIPVQMPKVSTKVSIRFNSA